jgi:hypothetical protein
MDDEINQKALDVYILKLGLYLNAGIRPEEIRGTFLHEIKKAKKDYWEIYQERKQEDALAKYLVWETIERNLDTYLMSGQFEFNGGRMQKKNSNS